MLHIALALALGCVHTSKGESRAGVGAATDPEPIGPDFFDTFYLNPDPERVDAALRWVAPAFASKPNIVPAVQAELSCIFARFPDHGQRWRATIDGLPEPAHELLAVALSSPPAVLFANSGPSPSRNDMHWGCYFATGDTAHIAAIVEELAHLAAPADLNLFLTAASAEWSLASNARQHPSVREFLERARGSAEPLREAQLDRILRVESGVLHADFVESLGAHRDAKTWGDLP